jgi:hypothetical protein
MSILDLERPCSEFAMRPDHDIVCEARSENLGVAMFCARAFLACQIEAEANHKSISADAYLQYEMFWNGKKLLQPPAYLCNLTAQELYKSEQDDR